MYRQVQQGAVVDNIEVFLPPDNEVIDFSGGESDPDMGSEKTLAEVNNKLGVALTSADIKRLNDAIDKAVEILIVWLVYGDTECILESESEEILERILPELYALIFFILFFFFFI